MCRPVTAIAIAIAAWLWPCAASAQAPPPPAAPAPAPRELAPPVVVRPLGYVEVYYAYNFRRPPNGITNYRGFDNRHDTFTLSNAALGATFESGPVAGKILLQIGSTPSTYYAAEPGLAGASGANPTGIELWKYLQEAWVSYEAPLGRGLLLQAGLVTSPIGVESIPVKDNWTWSRSSLFFGLPFYHTGVRATYAWSDAWSTSVSLFNGWNSVVDNNEQKSVQTNTTFRAGEDLSVNALYFGGVERAAGSIEGSTWRHLFELSARARLASRVAAVVQADYGFEPNRIGTARWWALAAMIRLRLAEPLHLVFRGDRFHEHLATDATRSSEPLFWGGSEWVTSGTATLDLRPHDRISFRLEGRHDASERPLYFTRGAAPDAPNARTQTTLLLGATAWF